MVLDSLESPFTKRFHPCPLNIISHMDLLISGWVIFFTNFHESGTMACHYRPYTIRQYVIVRSTSPSRPNKVGLKWYVRPSTWKMKFGMSVEVDEWCTRVCSMRPDSKSRSRAFERRKFVHFQRLSPPPFIMGAGKWPRILKLGHNT